MPDRIQDNAGKAKIGLGQVSDLSYLVEALISNVGAGIYLAQDRKFIYINPFLEDLSGYPAQDLIGHNCLDFVHPDDKESVRTKAIDSLRNRNNNAPAYEYRFVKNSGEIMWVMERISSIEYMGRRAVLGSFMDINRRKLLEEALVVYGERYRNILERMQDSYYELDLHGNFIFVNYATCQSLGYDWGELNGKNYRTIIPEDSRKEIYQVFHTVFETGEPNKGFSHKVQYKDGSTRFAESSVSLLLNDSGKPIGFTCVGRNVTERKKLEEALSRSEFRFRSILEQMHDACFEVDLTGRYVYVNQAMCRGLGYTQEEFLSSDAHLVTPADAWEALNNAYRKVYETGQPNTGVVHKVRRKDGMMGFSETSISLLKNETGQPVGFLCVGRDVTQQKLLEKALKTSEEKYRSILEQMQDSCFEIDLQGNYIYVNEAMCKQMEYAREEIIGKSYRDFVPRESWGGLIKAYTEVFSTGKPNTGVLHMIKAKSGYVATAETSISLLKDGTGKPVGFLCVGRDVTQKKLLEAALKKSEEKYRSILHQMQESYFECDLKGNYTFVNDALCASIGYSREEMMGMNYHALLPAEEQEPVINAYLEAYRTGKAGKAFTHKIVCKDGSPKFIDTSINLIRDENSKTIGYSCVARDFTEHKQLLDALAASEERYRGILEQLQDSYYEVDLKGNFTYANTTTCNNLGYTREELIGQSYRSSTPQSEIKDMFKAFNAVYRTGVPNPRHQHMGMRKNGEVFYAETSIDLARDGSGNVIGFRALSRDVTERKKLEDELVRSEEKYRSVLEEIEHSYYETSLSGDYTFANEQACRLLGYSMQELIGMNFKDIVPAEDVDYTFKSFNDVFKTGIPNNGFAHRVVRKDGSIVYAEASVTLARTKEGNITGFRVLSRNVTDRKRLEEELVRSEEKYRSILREMEDAYYEVDLKGNFTFINEACSRDLRYSKEELFGMNFSKVVSKDEVTNVFNNFNQVYRTGESNRGFSHRILRKDGTTGYAEASVSLVKNKQGKVIGFRAVSRDVTERKKLEQKLAEMATHDYLTGLPNRILLNDRFYVAVAHAHRSDSKLAVMSLDLDRFKAVNDTMGHSAGDELLRMVAIRLSYTLRTSDTVARIGGDEFVLLLQDIHNLEDATSIAEKIVESFKGPFVIEGHYLNISTSIGMAIYPDDGRDLDILMRKSDAAMYHSKKDGGSRYKVFSDSDRQELKS